MRRLLPLLLFWCLGCGPRLVDPCAGVLGTCLGIHVESADAMQVDALELQIEGGGLDIQKTVGDGSRLSLPVGLGFRFAQMPQSPNLQVSVRGMWKGQDVGGASAPAIVTTGEHQSLTLWLSRDSADGGQPTVEGTERLLQFVGPPWTINDLSAADTHQLTLVDGRPFAMTHESSTEIYARANDSLLEFVGPPWNVFNISNSVARGKIAGDPVGFQDKVFVRGIDASLLEFSGPPWSVVNLSESGTVPGVKIAGTPAVTQMDVNVLAVFARGQDGSLLQFKGPPWTVTKLSSPDVVGGVAIAGDPVIAQDGMDLEIFARGVDGSLLSFAAPSWNAENISSEIVGADARIAGDPVVARGGAYADLFVRGVDGSLVSFTRPTPWQFWNISALVTISGTPIEGNPALYTIGKEGHVFARGSHGELLEFVGAPWSVLADSAAGVIGGDPVVAGHMVFAVSAR